MMNRREAMVRLGMLAASGLIPGLLDAGEESVVHRSTDAFASSFRDVQALRTIWRLCKFV